jgi:glutamate--cysteine ligase catalytic subunit
MGLLTTGEPLEWPIIHEYRDIVKRRGIKGFLKIYEQYKDHRHDVLKWGDEIEFNLVRFDHINKRVYLLLKSSKLVSFEIF